MVNDHNSLKKREVEKISLKVWHPRTREIKPKKLNIFR